MSAESPAASDPRGGKEEESSEQSEREQTTGLKLVAPKIRVEKSRCGDCGGDAELMCKTCKMETVFCKKCARRSKHPHPLKAFRRRDEEQFNLRKHLTLSYYQHIVGCELPECMETCHESRYARAHFATCQLRPRHVLGLVHNGMVDFDKTMCMTCGLFITCVFLHADTCHVEKCHVTWCEQMREVFDLGTVGRPVFTMSQEMGRKCKEVHRAEWGRVQRKRHNRMLEEMMAVEL